MNRRICVYISAPGSGYDSSTLLTHSGPWPPTSLTKPSSSPTGTIYIPCFCRVHSIRLNAVVASPAGIAWIPDDFNESHFEILLIAERISCISRVDSSLTVEASNMRLIVVFASFLPTASFGLFSVIELKFGNISHYIFSFHRLRPTFVVNLVFNSIYYYSTDERPYKASCKILLFFCYL